MLGLRQTWAILQHFQPFVKSQLRNGTQFGIEFVFWLCKWWRLKMLMRHSVKRDLCDWLPIPQGLSSEGLRIKRDQLRSAFHYVWPLAVSLFFKVVIVVVGGSMRKNCSIVPVKDLLPSIESKCLMSITCYEGLTWQLQLGARASVLVLLSQQRCSSIDANEWKLNHSRPTRSKKR